MTMKLVAADIVMVTNSSTTATYTAIRQGYKKIFSYKYFEMPRRAEAAPTAEQSCSGWRGIFAALRNLLHLFFHKRSTNAEDLNPKSSCTHQYWRCSN